MKSSLLGILICLVSFTSCTEVRIPGLDLVGTTKTTDSSYVAPIEAKQDKVILIEELTGVGCANCPKAAIAIKTMSDANPGRILSIGMHGTNMGGLTDPLATKSKYDFRNESVDEIISYLGGYPSLPCGAFNRLRQPNGKIFATTPASWASRVDPLLDQTTPINIHIESNYSMDNNSGELIVKVAFTEDVQDDVFVTAYILENKIIDYQDVSSEKILYEHNHVFRKILTSVSGSSLNFADKNAGTVLQKRIPFEGNIEGVNAWNLDNCHIIAFVHKSGSHQSILQAQEINLK